MSYSDFEYEAEVTSGKEGILFFGHKGSGKTSAAYLLPGTKVVLSFDGKSLRAKEALRPNDKSITVLDARKYITHIKDKMTAGGRKTIDYTVWLLDETRKRGGCDWVVIDGLDILIEQCLPKDAVIYTPSGPVKVADYVGGPILSYDFNHGKCVYVEPLAVKKRKASELIEVRTASSVFRVTPGHPIYTRSDFSWKGLGWKDAGDLKPNDTVAIPLDYELPNHRRGVSPVLAKLVGYMVAEGVMSGKSSPTFVQTKESVTADFTRLVASEFPELDVISEKRPVKVGNVWHSSVIHRVARRGSKKGLRNSFAQRLKELGLWNTTSHTKYVPEEILYGPLESLRAFLQGYYAGDGWVAKSSTDRGYRYDCYTVSRRLKDDLIYALWRFGISPCVFEMSTGYQIHIGKGYFSKRFSEEVMGVPLALRGSRDTDSVLNGLYFERVKEVKKLDGVRDVWSFMTPTGSLIVDRHLTHNSEMAMRFDHKIGPLDPFAQMSWWKDRKLNIRLVHDMAFACAKVGVVWTTYAEKDDIVNNATLIRRTDVPRWMDIVMYDTDAVIRTQIDNVDGQTRFRLYVVSSKIKRFSTGDVLDVTGVQSLDKATKVGEEEMPNLDKAMRRKSVRQKLKACPECGADVVTEMGVLHCTKCEWVHDDEGD